MNVLPDYDSDEISAEKFANQLDYSKAVLKESFRLNPVSVGVGRIINTDLNLGGYNVPKDVKTIMVFFYLATYSEAENNPVLLIFNFFSR